MKDFDFYIAFAGWVFSHVLHHMDTHLTVAPVPYIFTQVTFSYYLCASDYINLEGEL